MKKYEPWRDFGADVDALKREGFSYREIVAEMNKRYDVHDFTYGKVRRYRRTFLKHGSLKVNTDASSFPRNEPAIDDYIDGNTRTVKVDGHSQIRSVEELLDAAGIDGDEWKVDEQRIKSWNGFHRGSEGETIVVQLFSVSAKLIPFVLKPVSPVISPIQIVHSKPKKLKKSSAKFSGALAFFDPHFGFLRDMYTGELTTLHDRQALDIALQAVERMKPAKIFIGGDILDLTEWSSKFASEPGFIQTTQQALVEAAWWLSAIRELAPDAKIYLLEGNHDVRLMDLQIRSMPESYGLKAVNEMHLPPALSLPHLLALHESGIAYIDGYPNNHVPVNNKLIVKHGNIARRGGTVTVKALLNDTLISVIHGHTHRSEHAAKTFYDGTIEPKEIEVWSSGCLCHIDGRVPGSNRKHDWQQGFMYIDYDNEDDHPAIVDVKIRNGKAKLFGISFEGSIDDYLNDFKTAVNAPF